MVKSALSWLWGIEPDFRWRDVIAGSWATWAVFVVTVVASTVDMLLPPTIAGVDPVTNLLGWSPVKVAGGEWWRVVTSTLTNSRVPGTGFLASPLGHLVTNMLGLVLVGPRLERAIGHARFVVLYVIAAVVADAAALAILPPYWEPGGGSSRSVYALFGGILVVAFLARRSSNYERQYFRVAAILIALLPGLVVTVGAIVYDAPENHVTHGAAFVVGTALTAAWLRRTRRVAFALIVAMLTVSMGLVSLRSLNEPRAGERVLRFVETPTTPTLITSAFGSVWTTSLENGVVTRIDPRTGRIVKTLRVSDAPGTLAASDRYVWVTANRRGLFAVDPATNRVVSRIPLRDSSWGVVATSDALWVALPLRDAVARIDLRTRKVVKRIPVADDPLMVTARGSDIWVTSAKPRTVSRIDTRSGKVAATIRLGRYAPYNMELDQGSLWVVAGKAIYRLDAESLKVLTVIHSKDWIFDLARSSNGSFWATHQFVYQLSHVDPSSGKFSRGIPLGRGKYFGVATDGTGRLWVADGLRHGLLQVEAAKGSRSVARAPLTNSSDGGGPADPG